MVQPEVASAPPFEMALSQKHWEPLLNQVSRTYNEGYRTVVQNGEVSTYNSIPAKVKPAAAQAAVQISTVFPPTFIAVRRVLALEESE